MEIIWRLQNAKRMSLLLRTQQIVDVELLWVSWKVLSDVCSFGIELQNQSSIVSILDSYEVNGNQPIRIYLHLCDFQILRQFEQ